MQKLIANAAPRCPWRSPRAPGGGERRAPAKDVQPHAVWSCYLVQRVILIIPSAIYLCDPALDPYRKHGAIQSPLTPAGPAGQGPLPGTPCGVSSCPGHLYMIWPPAVGLNTSPAARGSPPSDRLAGRPQPRPLPRAPPGGLPGAGPVNWHGDGALCWIQRFAMPCLSSAVHGGPACPPATLRPHAGNMSEN